MTASALIDLTLEEITCDYQPGTLPWLKKNRPKEWIRLLEIEGAINHAALSGDEKSLTTALEGYRVFMTKALGMFETKGMTLDLFR
jgi:hypothetical protein